MILRNIYDEYKDVRTKSEAFTKAVQNHIKAIDSNGNMINMDLLNLDDVAYVSGAWRVQVDFPYKISNIRKRDMVLLEKLNRVENTLFEFWSAKFVGYNCYGPFVSKNEKPDCIVAKYDTDNGAFWGYGETLEKARAFLGLKVYDEYKEVINAIACRQKLRKNK
nr:hypothetical protein [Candidatus Enterousia merdequi]